jgi:hypothetical protein
MGGAAGPDLRFTSQSGEREMTQTLEGIPAAGGGRTLGRRVTARRSGAGDRATGPSATAAGHRGEAGTP